MAAGATAAGRADTLRPSKPVSWADWKGPSAQVANFPQLAPSGAQPNQANAIYVQEHEATEARVAGEDCCRIPPHHACHLLAG